MKNNSKAEATTTTTASNQKQNLGEQAFALWMAFSKNNVPYLSGKVNGDDNFKIVAFANGSKKNVKEPDIRVYAKGNTKEEVASLWESLSPTTGKRYLKGKDNEGKKLIGFYNHDNGSKSKQPYITVYYKEG